MFTRATFVRKKSAGVWLIQQSSAGRLSLTLRLPVRAVNICVNARDALFLTAGGTRLTATKRTDREATHARLYHIACPRNRLAPNALGFHRQQLSRVRTCASCLKSSS